MSTSRPIVNPGQLPAEPAWVCPSHVAGQPQPLALQGIGWHIPKLLAEPELRVLRAHGLQHCTTPVGRDGISPNYRQGDQIGSWRASAFAPETARALWGRLQHLDWPTTLGPLAHCDWDGHPRWRACGVNPLMRFILYRPSAGELVAHYDAPYVESMRRKTLFTLILYLSTHIGQGQTRFIQDAQDHLPLEKRDFSDWSRCARQDEVRLSCAPVQADALVFEHRLLHDSSPVVTDTKLVVRTDIFFERQ